MPRIRVRPPDVGRQAIDLAVCFAGEGDKAPRAIDDPRLKRELAAAMAAERFRGRAGDTLQWTANGRYGPRRFVILGLGRPDGPAGATIRAAATRAAQCAVGLGAREVVVCLPDGDPDEVRAAAEGALGGAYQFDRHLTDPNRKKGALERIDLAVGGKNLGPAVRRAEIVGRAVRLARDLVNEGPSRLTPLAFARIARTEARARGLSCKVLRRRELERLGFDALLAVSRGSAAEPCVVHLVYKPAKPRKDGGRTVIAGKGVTFDSGGLDLKPADYMLNMKGDMAGAAAVLGAMTTLRELDCRLEVHGLLGLTENMTGSAAYKPGDVLDTYSGKTVEVGNTDAEGRLVLCDVLAWAAERLRPTRMVDLATLTGACVVALGPLATGLFTRHEALRDELLAAGAAAGEKLWPMPMFDEYVALLQKGPADLRNVAGRYGGAITAALFLGEFVPRELAWAHLDIAGPAFTEIEAPDAPAGGTGAGVSTLVRWLERG